MRFSIRWLLAITAYIAPLAATIGTQNRNLVDLVWVVTLVAFCYAVVVAFIDRGKRQAMAIGFVAVAAAHVTCLYLVPTQVPAVRLYQAFGYTINTFDGPSLSIYEPSGGNGGVTSGPRASYNAAFKRVKGHVPDLRTSSGAMTLVAGLIGCSIGVLAYKHRTA